MGGHFDAVGFGNPARGFEATREHLRAAVEQGQRVATAGEVAYYELESPEGCGLTAATDRAGFLLSGCPYFRGTVIQTVEIETLFAWDPAAPDQGGCRARLPRPGGRPGLELTIALPRYAAEVARGRRGPTRLNLIGLGYQATARADEHNLALRPTADRASSPLRRCNIECRGRVERARLLTNSVTGARLAYARLDCGDAPLEVVLDLPSLAGGLVQGVLLSGNFWLVGRPLDA